MPGMGFSVEQLFSAYTHVQDEVTLFMATALDWMCWIPPAKWLMLTWRCKFIRP